MTNAVPYTFRRRYQGPVRAVILDWAGTTLDFGCLAPVSVFRAAFAAEGVEVSLAEARGPMGMEKRAHIAAMLAEPGIAARWRAVKGMAAGQDDIDRMFARFIPLQMQALAGHADLIPGTVETAAYLRGRGISIGSNTGYSRPMMDVLAPLAARAGYAPDVIVCPEDTGGQGRPTPFMAFRILEQLGVYPVAATVKVDDTPSGIAEGLNAGMWTVGVALTGNAMGLSAADLAALPAAERMQRREAAHLSLATAGAHIVIDSIAELPATIAAIEARLALGETP